MIWLLGKGISFLTVSKRVVSEIGRPLYLAYYSDRHGQVALGPQLERLPVLLKLFGFVLGTELVDERGAQQIVQLMKQLKGGVPAEELQKAFENAQFADPSHAEKLMSILRS